MKHGIMLHDPDHFPTVLGLFVFNLVGLGEEYGRGPLAFADLPVFVLRLLVGHPARIAALDFNLCLAPLQARGVSLADEVGEGSP